MVKVHWKLELCKFLCQLVNVVLPANVTIKKVKMEVGWFLQLLICVRHARTDTAAWFEVFDKTTNYDAHPSRGTVLFVKAILTADCEAFMFYTVSGEPQFHSTPTIKYTKTANGGKLVLEYDYSSLDFASSGPHKRVDSIVTDVANFSHGFSFTLSFAKSKVHLIFNGRLFFMDIAEIMLLDDHEYESYFIKSRPVVFVAGCTSSKQSFELGAYGEHGYTGKGTSIVRSFMGLTLNYHFGRDVNVVYVAKHAEYDGRNYEIVKDFGYDLEVGDNAYQFSISMEFVSNSHRKERANITTDILYVVTGSAHLSVNAPCATRVKAPIVCEPRSTDFYFTALRVGHARRKYEEGITNRTWSRCALHGPSKYRDILDRSQRLTLTYSFYEDLELMRQHDQRKTPSVTLIKGERLPRENENKFVANKNGD
uniref:VWFD domain-containing protein n=1 Tax=Ascaris lumbricoides TaxID=6252 RepID=A0A9J2Q800_ASCLU